MLFPLSLCALSFKQLGSVTGQLAAKFLNLFGVGTWGQVELEREMDLNLQEYNRSSSSSQHTPRPPYDSSNRQGSPLSRLETWTLDLSSQRNKKNIRLQSKLNTLHFFLFEIHLDFFLHHFFPFPHLTFLFFTHLLFFLSYFLPLLQFLLLDDAERLFFWRRFEGFILYLFS